jgi:hypothetical protein
MFSGSKLRRAAGSERIKPPVNQKEHAEYSVAGATKILNNDYCW